MFPLFENELLFWDDSRRKINLVFMEGWNTSTHSIRTTRPAGFGKINLAYNAFSCLCCCREHFLLPNLFFFENVVCSIGFWIEAFGLLLLLRLSISKVDHVGLMGPLNWVNYGFACQFD